MTTSTVRQHDRHFILPSACEKVKVHEQDSDATNHSPAVRAVALS